MENLQTKETKRVQHFLRTNDNSLIILIAGIIWVVLALLSVAAHSTSERVIGRPAPESMGLPWLAIDLFLPLVVLIVLPLIVIGYLLVDDRGRANISSAEALATSKYNTILEGTPTRVSRMGESMRYTVYTGLGIITITAPSAILGRVDFNKASYKASLTASRQEQLKEQFMQLFNIKNLVMKKVILVNEEDCLLLNTMSTRDWFKFPQYRKEAVVELEILLDKATCGASSSLHETLMIIRSGIKQSEFRASTKIYLMENGCILDGKLTAIGAEDIEYGRMEEYNGK